jgi:hypothetical protein
MIKAALRGKVDESKLLMPTLHFRFFERALLGEMTEYFSEKFGISKTEIRKAVYNADAVQTLFEKAWLIMEKRYLKQSLKTAGRLYFRKTL